MSENTHNTTSVFLLRNGEENDPSGYLDTIGLAL